MTSFHGAGGPGSAWSRPRANTTATATSGDSATANAYGIAESTPNAASSRQAVIRITPSEPITKAYELNRPWPAQMPRARWAGAYDTKAVANAAIIHQSPSK